MKTSRAGGLRFLLVVLPAVAFSHLAHADDAAPPPAPAASTELAMLPAPASQPPAAVVATTQPAPVVAKAEDPTLSHLGADAVVGGGLVTFVGASARLEVRPTRSSSFLARVGYMRGSVIDDDSLRAASFGLGYRGHFGRGYIGTEVAILALSEKTNGSGPWGDWEPIGNLTSSLGAKLGAVDASVQIMYPLVSVGLNVGVDFSTF